MPAAFATLCPCDLYAAGSVLFLGVMLALLVFCRKDLCEARPKMQCVQICKCAFYTEVRLTPPYLRFQVSLTFLSDFWIRITFGEMYPSRDILWPYLELLQVRLTFSQTYPPGRGISWPSLELLQVRLTFGKMYPPSGGI